MAESVFDYSFKTTNKIATISEPKWINCKDKMPNISEVVWTGYFDEDGEWIIDDHLCYCSDADPNPRFGDCQITHWMYKTQPQSKKQL